MYVHRARNVTHASRHLLCKRIVCGLRCHSSCDGNVNWGRRAEIQNLGDYVRRLEVELNTGESLRQFRAQLIDVVAGTFRSFTFELNEDFRVGCANRAGITVAEIDAAVWKADV